MYLIVPENDTWLLILSDVYNFANFGYISLLILFFFFSVPVCAITASGVPGGTFVSMNRFSTLCW